MLRVSRFCAGRLSVDLSSDVSVLECVGGGNPG